MRITDTALKLLKLISAGLLRKATDLQLNRDTSTLNNKLLDMHHPRLLPTKLLTRDMLNRNKLRDIPRQHRHGDKDHNNLNNKVIDLLLNLIMVLPANNRISMVDHNNLIHLLPMVVKPLIALHLV